MKTHHPLSLALLAPRNPDHDPRRILTPPGLAPPGLAARVLTPLVLALSVASCKYEVEPMDAQPAADLTMPPVQDLSMPPDLLVPPDLGGLCSRKAGQRVCATDSRSSVQCAADETYVTDRVCTGAGCFDGHCNTPTVQRTCGKDADCVNGQTCQLFTNTFAQYGLYCAPPPGAGALFAQCTSHADCASNVCYPFGNGANPRCTHPCQVLADCQGAGTCSQLDPVVEGFKLSTAFCFPN